MLRRSDESPVSRHGDGAGHTKAKTSHTVRGKNGKLWCGGLGRGCNFMFDLKWLLQRKCSVLVQLTDRKHHMLVAAGQTNDTRLGSLWWIVNWPTNAIFWWLLASPQFVFAPFMCGSFTYCVDLSGHVSALTFMITFEEAWVQSLMKSKTLTQKLSRRTKWSFWLFEYLTWDHNVTITAQM